MRDVEVRLERAEERARASRRECLIVRLSRLVFGIDSSGAGYLDEDVLDRLLVFREEDRGSRRD